MTIHATTVAEVELLTPHLWAWMHEYPEANLDDTAPATGEAFTHEMIRRLATGERLWAVSQDGETVGAIGYQPLTVDTGSLHGVCFVSWTHGKGIAAPALCAVLDVLRGDGVRKISATYFADNRRIRSLLERCGFQPEGYLTAHTCRHHVWCDCILVAQLLR
jgi:RimJ/RimL family protein N-acetyltransferase